MRRVLAALSLCSLAFGFPARAWAQEAVPTPAEVPISHDASPGSGLRWQAAAGVAALRYARSLALSHNIKPQASLRALWACTPHLFLGPELSGILSTRSEYAVWSAGGAVVYQVELGGALLGAELGLGVGHAAEILYEDLRSPGAVTWMSTLGVSALWRLSPQLHWGAALRARRASILGLSSVLQF